MDQAQTKTLAAIQPFVHLATTTKSPSPRFVAELVRSAISAPGAYLFTELLQTPAVQSLRGTESEAWLTLLEIFSWGTYEEYKDVPGLPELDEPQTFKLRQLSLLTLASPVAPNTTTTTNLLTYPSLLKSLSLTDDATLESLVTQSIYSGLLTARLSPTSTPPIVHITSVAPLRDLRPQSLPALLQILQTWESRCTAMVSDLESQIAAIRTTASQRTLSQRSRQDIIDAAVLSDKPIPANDGNGNGNGAGGGQGLDTDRSRGGAAAMRGARGGPGQRPPSKRDIDQHMEGEGDELSDDDGGRMDLDEGISDLPNTAAGGPGHGRGGGHSSRGAKRNRGRGTGSGSGSGSK